MIKVHTITAKPRDGQLSTLDKEVNDYLETIKDCEIINITTSTVFDPSNGIYFTYFITYRDKK